MTKINFRVLKWVCAYQSQFIWRYGKEIWRDSGTCWSCDESLGHLIIIVLIRLSFIYFIFLHHLKWVLLSLCFFSFAATKIQVMPNRSWGFMSGVLNSLSLANSATFLHNLFYCYGSSASPSILFLVPFPIFPCFPRLSIHICGAIMQHEAKVTQNW